MVAAEPETVGGICAKHYTERAVGHCEDCHERFCAECLVPPLRKRMPTRCVDCALVAAGIRAAGPRRHGVVEMNRTMNHPTRR